VKEPELCYHSPYSPSGSHHKDQKSIIIKTESNIQSDIANEFENLSKNNKRKSSITNNNNNKKSKKDTISIKVEVEKKIIEEENNNNNNNKRVTPRQKNKK
jgi:hypothetical protein